MIWNFSMYNHLYVPAWLNEGDVCPVIAAGMCVALASEAQSRVSKSQPHISYPPPPHRLSPGTGQLWMGSGKGNGMPKEWLNSCPHWPSEADDDDVSV